MKIDPNVRKVAVHLHDTYLLLNACAGTPLELGDHEAWYFTGEALLPVLNTITGDPQVSAALLESANEANDMGAILDNYERQVTAMLAVWTP